MSFQWNDLEGYGTYYPKELSELDFSENGKGFSATDGVAELWVDTYLWMLPNDSSETAIIDDEDELVGANFYLQGRKGPKCVMDIYVYRDDLIERNKTVAYKGAFYTVSFAYPPNQTEHYQPFEKGIFDDFPVLNKPVFHNDD